MAVQPGNREQGTGHREQEVLGSSASPFPVSRSRFTDPRDFGRVAVVMGGSSAEREVSLDSGRGVLKALKSRGVDAHAIDGIPALLDAVRAGHFARVFNILHGQHGGGEDGVLQGALDSLHVPYTGSGVLGSALSMDKVRSKWIWTALGLPTPKFVPLPRAAVGSSIHEAARAVGFPLIVKPASEGSSVGVSRVFDERDLDGAVALAQRYPGDLLMETLIEGGEFTVSILGREVLPSIRIVPKGEYYDYNAKYVAEDTQYICPGLEGEAEAELRALALQAFDALGCSGWGRVDMMRDAQGHPWLLEVNTAPGMTSHSLVPKAAAAAGMDYAELCWRVLETSFDQEAGTGNREGGTTGGSASQPAFPASGSRTPGEGGAP
ncbi:MAG TPA: D-alanine--D-alanine ligase [Rhodanobacteraceae bacterium]|nr:D-alanine--D-alanine ligase [Rhodanobacteraceae bacterium]